MSNLDRETAAIAGALASGLAHNVPEDVLPGPRRLAVANEFLEAVGRLLEALEAMHPSAAKGAALLYVVDRLGLDRAGVDDAKVMVTLVESMKVIAQNAAAARDAAGKPQGH